MARGKWLTQKEKIAIDALLKEGYSVKEVSDNGKRSPTAIRNYMARKKQGESKTKTGRPKKLTPCMFRLLQNVTKNGGMTARKVMNATGVVVSLRTVQSTLASNEHLQFRKLQSRPPLSHRHIKNHFEGQKK